MTRSLYRDQTEQQNRDTGRVFEAFDELKKFEAKYGDLVVIPETITILDVAEAELSTRTGPTKSKDIFTRDELLAALQVLKASPCANVPEAIYQAVLDYRQTHKLPKE